NAGGLRSRNFTSPAGLTSFMADGSRRRWPTEPGPGAPDENVGRQTSGAGAPDQRPDDRTIRSAASRIRTEKDRRPVRGGRRSWASSPAGAGSAFLAIRVGQHAIAVAVEARKHALGGRVELIAAHRPVGILVELGEPAVVVLGRVLAVAHAVLGPEGRHCRLPFRLRHA